MSGKKKVFDDGFDAFEGKKDFIDKFAEGVATVGERIHELPLDKVREKENVRKTYSNIEDLAETIRQNGLLQPIRVQKTTDGFFDILTGHRRFKAYLYLNNKYSGEFGKIQAIVFEKELSRVEIVRIQLIENLQRENPSALDTKGALEGLREMGLSNREIGEKIGKSENHVKQLFSTIHTINANPELGALLQSVAGDTLGPADFQEIRPLPPKDQVAVLKDRAEGKIKTRAELRERVKDLKDAGYNEYRQVREEKKSKPLSFFDWQSESTFKVRFSFDIKKTTEAEKKKLVEELRAVLQKLEAGS